ncbi:MAG: hypothetical protein AAB531_00985 [Patescibacteria group bacterium]
MNVLKAINQKGQTIVEVAVALSVAVVIVSAIVVSIINALNNEKFGVSQNQATQLAQGGVDLFRDLSQSDWVTFTSYGSASLNGLTSCLPEVNPIPPGARHAIGCSPNAGNNTYVREINVELNVCVTPTPGVINSARVKSTVRWADTKCTDSANPYCHKTEVVSCMFKPFVNSSP